MACGAGPPLRPRTTKAEQSALHNPALHNDVPHPHRGHLRSPFDDPCTPRSVEYRVPTRTVHAGAMAFAAAQRKCRRTVHRGVECPGLPCQAMLRRAWLLSGCSASGWPRTDPNKPLKSWSGRRDSNPRPQPWQGCALPLSYARAPSAPGRDRARFLGGFPHDCKARQATAWSRWPPLALVWRHRRNI
jgi:hypothetical protein